MLSNIFFLIYSPLLVEIYMNFIKSYESRIVYSETHSKVVEPIWISINNKECIEKNVLKIVSLAFFLLLKKV